MVGEHEDDVVLDCYRLARWYHQPPDLFLEMPLSKVRLHLVRTIQLAKIMQDANRSEEDDG